MPWMGVDPIVVSSQIVLGLQTVVSRQTNLTQTPLVISIGQIHSGVKSNIISAEVEMEGKIRTFDPTIRKTVQESIKKMATTIAEASGATAEVSIPISGCPVTYNNPKLFGQMESTLKRVAKRRNMTSLLVTGAEDFAFYAEKIPAVFFILGVSPDGKMIPNHSPYFDADESALIVGVQAMSNMAVDFLKSAK